MALMTYLLRDKAGTYYFRRCIPAVLRPFMPAPFTGKREWKRTLGTKDPLKAKRLKRGPEAECDANFEEAGRASRGGEPISRSPSTSPSNLRPEDVELDAMAELLTADEADRVDGDSRRQHQSPEERAQWPDLVPVPFGRRGMAEDEQLGHGEALELLNEDFRQALSRSDPSIVDAELRALLRRRGVAADPLSDGYYQLGMAMLRGHVRAYGLLLRRHKGEVVRTPTPSTGRGPKLSQAYEAWKAGSGVRGGRMPTSGTILEADYAVRRLTEWHGDLPLGDLTRERTREFRDALAKVPIRMTGDLRGLPLRDLLSRDLSAYPPQHAASVNKHLNLLSAIVSHAEAAGRLDAVPNFKNPFGRGLKLAVDARAASRRLPFSVVDLRAIFSTGVFAAAERSTGGGGEAAFWLPLLALLSGARQGELAALRVMDLAQEPESGVWHFDIGTTGGRSIKTASSRRKVPIHPELLRIGLLRYREGLLGSRAGMSAPLWPHIDGDNAGRRGGPWSQWFTRYLRGRAGIKEPGKVFHSFRHTFKDACRDAGLREEVHDALTGHAGNGGIGRSYGQGFGLEALAVEVERIAVPAVLAGLIWEPGPAPRARRRRFRGALHAKQETGVRQ